MVHFFGFISTAVREQILHTLHGHLGSSDENSMSNRNLYVIDVAKRIESSKLVTGSPKTIPAEVLVF